MTKQSKHFFFRKKKQKTFLNSEPWRRWRNAPIPVSKSFFAAFCSQKEVFLACLLLTACTAPAAPPGLAASGPAFNPVAFFTGHVTSWGVEENRAGDPTAVVTTDCTGTPTGANAIRMVQTLHIGTKPPQTRIWTITETGPATYIATANDMAAPSTGTVTGRAFHLRWILQASPGNDLANVTMDQWMYRMDDGAVMIRTIVTKLNIRLLEVSEQFVKQP